MTVASYSQQVQGFRLPSEKMVTPVSTWSPHFLSSVLSMNWAWQHWSRWNFH